MLTKAVLTDRISFPGFANLLAFVFLNVFPKICYKPVKNRGLLSHFSLDRQEIINLFILKYSSEMSFLVF